MKTLKVEGLTARYGRIQVCRGVSLDINAGEVLVLIGPNGAGKSSTLGAIAGAVASSGSVLVDGRELEGKGASRRARMGVSLVPEGRRNLFGSLTVEDNLLIGLRLLPSVERELMSAELHAMFPILRARGKQLASLLSGGEQQLVAIAVAVARKPAVLLLDEPSQGLAPVALDALVTAIAELRKRGLAVALAEQNYEFAIRLADRFVALRSGEIVARGTGSELADRDIAASVVMGH
jgi:branched-chain amino acid transport system ATP-binding protein